MVPRFANGSPNILLAGQTAVDAPIIAPNAMAGVSPLGQSESLAINGQVVVSTPKETLGAGKGSTFQFGLQKGPKPDGRDALRLGSQEPGGHLRRSSLQLELTAQTGPGWAGLASDPPHLPSSLAVDRNPLHLPLSCRQFRQGDGDHTVLERRGDFFLVDVIDRNTPLETSVVALAEETLLVIGFALLFSTDRQHAVRKFERNVVLVEAGKFSDNLDFLIGFVEFDAGPTHHPGRAERTDIEAAECLVEHAVHLTMERKKRIACFVALHGHIA